ncbi:MAG: hypothetical protein J6V70_07160, partial [Kiritimatiellae bacterium]|nr:hypothetical protein [Kiritimatiellia bacterium]
MKKFLILSLSALAVLTVSLSSLVAAPKIENKDNVNLVGKYVSMSRNIVEADESAREDVVANIVKTQLEEANTADKKLAVVSELVSMTIATVVDYSRFEIISLIETMARTIMESTEDPEEQIKY